MAEALQGHARGEVPLVPTTGRADWQWRRAGELALSSRGCRREWPSQSDGFVSGARSPCQRRLGWAASRLCAPGAASGLPLPEPGPGTSRDQNSRSRGAHGPEVLGKAARRGQAEDKGWRSGRAGSRRDAWSWRNSAAAGSRVPSPRPRCAAENPAAGERREAPPRRRTRWAAARGSPELQPAARDPRSIPRSAPAF